MAMKLLMKARVVATQRETARIKSFVLAHATRPELPAFEAGAHTTVVLPSGLKRQYSLCSDPADRRAWRIAVLRQDEGYGGSRAMHDLREGDTLFISYPANHFPLADDAAFHLLIAGGIGITPLVAMAYALKARGARFRLHYCADSVDELALHDELRAAFGHDSVQFHPSRGLDASPLDLAALLRHRPAGAHVYVCGPRRMNDAVVATSEKAGWPKSVVHFELFCNGSLESARHGDPFEIEIASSGAVLPVPGDKSALEILRSHGFTIDSACEAGLCGTCRVGYSAGEPIHRDMALGVAERTTAILTCVSRARGRIVLTL